LLQSGYSLKGLIITLSRYGRGAAAFRAIRRPQLLQFPTDPLPES